MADSPKEHSSSQHGSERRRYFRVTDLVGLRYKFLSDGECELAVQAQPTSLKSLLSQIENQIVTDMVVIQNTHPEIHHVLDLFNQKINLAFGHGLAKGSEEDMGESTRACHVNLSACGIVFSCAKAAVLGQYVSLALTLYPSNIRLNLLAAVIASEHHEDEADDSKYLIRADFVNIADADQEVLVQHVIKRQAHQLQEQRGGANS